MKKSTRPFLSVVLPTYNERDNIGPLIRAVLDHAPRATEVIVVDDDSPDGTWRLVSRLARTLGQVRLLRRTAEKGLTRSLRDGIALARGRVVAWMDCDLSMPPEKIPELLRGLAEGYDLVAGSRYVPGGGVEIRTGSPDSPWAYLTSLFLNRYLQCLLGRDFKDYTSGFVAVKREVLDRISLRGDYGEYFIDLVYRAKRLGYRLLEVPYLCRARQHGRGKTFAGPADVLRKGGRYLLLPLKLRLGTMK